MLILAGLKALKPTLIANYAKPDDRKGLSQVLSTLLPLAALWLGISLLVDRLLPLTAVLVAAMCLLLLRVFVLMHECGHGSLFRTPLYNKCFGFILGVVSGMPQYVWSQRHHFHHSTNGNWDRYRGPLGVIAVDEYAAMNESQQRRYRQQRSIWLAPLAGFMYLIFNPRYTWLKGSAQLLLHVARGRMAEPGLPLGSHARTFKTGFWNSPQEYWHMFWNNCVLFAAWALMAWAVGPLLFFACYVLSVSVAGGTGILLFTVQHNFEHSYASQDEGWDYDQAALEGTSFLILPAWLNWVTANIAYHHVHHLSARIPNYCLAACHREYEQMFAGVTRITLSRIPAALRCILWDTKARRIVSVAEYQASALAAA